MINKQKRDKLIYEPLIIIFGAGGLAWLTASCLVGEALFLN
jgi:hypothetical protein